MGGAAEAADAFVIRDYIVIAWTSIQNKDSNADHVANREKEIPLITQQNSRLKTFS